MGSKPYKIILLILVLFFLYITLFESPLLAEDLQGQGVSNFYKIYITKPITNVKILLNAMSNPGSVSNAININACRGQYEPASFVVRSAQKILGLGIAATELKGEQSTIPAGAVDIRVVKCWFQAGRLLHVPGPRQYLLTPELLLRDDKLIYVDLEKKENYLRTNGLGDNYILISGPTSENLRDLLPKNSDTLQPVDIDINTNKQFWITVHVPEDAMPGLYIGKLVISTLNSPPSEIPLRLRVLPFRLEKPTLRYAIYYRGKLTRYPPESRILLIKDGEPAISSEWKSAQQYESEMRDLKNHGVEFPTIYQPDTELLIKELEIREKIGLPKDALYFCFPGTGNPVTQDKLDELKKRVKSRIELARQQGYKEVYFYGLDEAKGEKLLSQRPAWKAVHDMGGKVFAASFPKGIFEEMGDLLDLHIWYGRPDPREAEKYHKIGHQIFSYNNPQVGMEEPETYRRNFGLVLWQAGYDGAMDYAYQHGMNHIWNDFDYSKNYPYRDPVFAYPTIDGVIDTVQWEGFREGVDDVRYLTTLIEAIKKTKVSHPQIAAAAQQWVSSIDPQGDLDTIRASCIEWILKLQN